MNRGNSMAVVKMNQRPEFIPEDWWERDANPRWLNAFGRIAEINRFGKPQTILVSSYIARCKQNPIENNDGMYKLKNVIARVLADNLTIVPPEIETLRSTVRDQQQEIERLQALVADNSKELHELKCLNAVIQLTGKRLPDKKYILAHTIPNPGTQTGIYFLVKDDDIVYVGQSTDFQWRLAIHLYKKDFDSMAFLPCKEDDLDIIESGYIHRFEPRQNGRRANGLMNAPISWHELMGFAYKGINKMKTESSNS
jgi:hypothetical protein